MFTGTVYILQENKLFGRVFPSLIRLFICAIDFFLFSQKNFPEVDRREKHVRMMWCLECRSVNERKCVYFESEMYRHEKNRRETAKTLHQFVKHQLKRYLLQRFSAKVKHHNFAMLTFTNSHAIWLQAPSSIPKHTDKIQNAFTHLLPRARCDFYAVYLIWFPTYTKLVHVRIRF